MSKTVLKKYDVQFDKNYFYDGDDLGISYQKDKTSFKLWAPLADKVYVNLYKDGLAGMPYSRAELVKLDRGVWHTVVEGDLDHIFYTYTVGHGSDEAETTDPYLKVAGANGVRGMILDLAATNPDGWEEDKKPEFLSMTDAVIYETHIRDLTMDENSGIQHKGKFIGLAETGTKNKEGLSTGLDHMKEMGITHVHLLPVFDYGSVDETHPEKAQFNWGYDPVNYNTPEGSYSTNPYDGAVRIKEFKEMVKVLHKNGIRVIMDVVYNHTYSADDTCFTKTVPGYYYRRNQRGYTNGSGCGNETASDHLMFRKYMVDSLLYWTREYHVDGFRFDLMAVHDIDTMNEIEHKLHQYDPTLLIYGEGWNGGNSGLEKEKRALKKYASSMPGIGFFNDDIRDAVKGDVFLLAHKGFINGKKNIEDKVKFSVTGATGHESIPKIKPWACAASQSINYVSAHDNLTLWDKLSLTNPEQSLEDRIRMNKLAAAIVFTSQGIPFIQSGEEMLRTKPSERPGELFDENSYQSSDAVNCIKWERKGTYKEVVEYYKGLIAFRKHHPALRMENKNDINRCIHFLSFRRRNLVAYVIERPNETEEALKICVIYNGNQKRVTMELPKGDWTLYIDNNSAGVNSIGPKRNGKILVPPVSAMVFCLES